MNKYIVWGIVIVAVWYFWMKNGYKLPFAGK